MGTLEKLRQKLLARPVEMNFAEVKKVLEADGWILDRVSGSHHQFTKPGQPILPIAVHDKKVKRSAITEIAARISQPGG